MPAPAAPASASPLERALLAWLVAVIAIGGGWLGAVVLADPGLKRLVAGGGGAFALAVALAVAVAAYHATAARNARTALAAFASGGDRLEHRLFEVCDRTLPALAARVRDGAPADTVLAELPPPSDESLRHLLMVVAHELADARRTATAARATAASVEDDLAHLLEVTLPAMAERVRADCASPGTLRELFEPPATGAVARLQEAVAAELARTQERGTATTLACAEGAARLQAQAAGLLAVLSELEHRYDEQAVFGDLLDVDHRVSQMGRVADTVAILAGGRPGRRWTAPIPMESVLRGAMGRIADYRRIRPHATGTCAVAAHAAEAVMHALAELLDNATAFAPRDTDVHVYVEEEDAGVVVTIEDGGPGMSPRERARAERLIADPDLTATSGTRLGLPVVGRLARRHGLRVGFRPSARGGVGVVMLIPLDLVTRPLSPPDQAPALPLEAPRREQPALPQRRRTEGMAAVPPETPATPPENDPEAAAARLTAFHKATPPIDHDTPTHTTPLPQGAVPLNDATPPQGTALPRGAASSNHGSPPNDATPAQNVALPHGVATPEEAASAQEAASSGHGSPACTDPLPRDASAEEAASAREAVSPGRDPSVRTGPLPQDATSPQGAALSGDVASPDEGAPGRGGASSGRGSSAGAPSRDGVFPRGVGFVRGGGSDVGFSFGWGVVGPEEAAPRRVSGEPGDRRVAGRRDEAGDGGAGS
ncbi:ATP-binding protein [Actinomadura kijaniata]|uniref:ATP-binding protein n=1 Tax=Actinomadura kijaniata TaxID=46161 RepID=UPI00083609F9|nr:ATP-binding protein [Actinomadura kijaniata]